MTSTFDRESDPGVRPGDVLAGKYRVERILGVGGMGVVVAAHHIQLDEKVALKFLLPDALQNPEALARFEREARAAVKIKNEHVARVSDVGKLDGGSPYMVMEYLEGSDLSALLEKQGPLPIDRAVDFVLQACEAIAEAHALGIVHRDLKPANLFCIRRRDGGLCIKVLDFGISKVTPAGGVGSGSRDMGMTKTTTVIGSPVYMSPEQMQSSKGVDERTDIWAIGVILFELLTGRVPFNGQTVTELAIHVATEPTPGVNALRMDVPPALEAVVARCLEKGRERRYQNVSELASALVDFGSKQARVSLERIQGMLGVADTVAPPIDFGSSPTATNGTRSGGTVAPWQSTGGTGSQSKSKAGPLAIAAALGVAVLVGGGALLLRKGPAPIAPPVAAVAAAAAAVVVPPSPAPSAAPVPSRPASSVAAADAPPAVAAAHAPPSPAPRASAAAPPRPAPAAPSKAVHCTPPYFFDAQGNRVFKPECM
jgi:serine/threonine-protein kinase